MAAYTRKQYSGAARNTTTTTLLTNVGTTVDIAATTGWPSLADIPFYVVIQPASIYEEKCLATRTPLAAYKGLYNNGAVYAIGDIVTTDANPYGAYPGANYIRVGNPGNPGYPPGNEAWELYNGSILGSTLSLVRAQDDTTASQHPIGSVIYPVFTANDADEANEVVSKLTTKGDLLVTTGNSLERLPVGANGTFLKANSSASVGAEWSGITLGTDTSGNYVSDFTQGTGVTITHTPGEGSNATIGIGQAVGTSASVTFANVTADLVGDVTGNADTATALETARTISLGGDLSGSASFNGTSDITISASVVNSGISLDEILDVVITNPLEFQTLEYNGTNWVNANAQSSVYVRNAEATTITTGTAVYLFGATGDHATVKRADNTVDTTSSKTVGLVSSNILTSDNGVVVSQGYVDGIDLSTGYAAGDVLWLGKNGQFTKTKPTAPDHLVFIGVVVRATNNGIVYVSVQNGYELDELHNVKINGLTDGQFLRYNSASVLWVNDTINLGTDTAGDYVQNLTAGTGVTLSNNSGEGSSPTVAIGQDVATSASPTFARITISGTPSSTTDAVTKSYVDNVAAGVNWHEAVSYATTAVLPNTPTYDNGADGVGATLTAGSSARLMVDGLNVSNGNRILVKNQSTQTQNGIYDVTEQGSVSTPWILTRAADFNQNTVAGSIDTGEAVYVRLGNFNAGTGHVLTSTGTGDGDRHIPGTDNFVFTQFSGLTTTVAGAGLTTNGTSISVGTASSGRIVVNADDIDLATVAQSNSTAADTLSFAKTVNVDSYGRVTGVVSASIDLSSKANLAGPTFTGTVVLPSTTSIGDVSSTEIGYLNNVTSAIQSQIDAKAPLDSPTFTGTVTLPNDTVALGTKTTGDYVQSLVAGTGVSLANNSGESATPTVSIGQSVATTASVSFAKVTADLAGNVTGNVTGDVTGNVSGSSGSTTGNAATATTLQNARTISISGDVSGSVSFNGSTNVDISATIQPNSVALGTDTTGNYVSDLTQGTGVTITHTPGEGSNATIAIGQAIGTSDSPTFAGVNVNGSIVFEGTTANDFETTLSVTDPTADNTITLPNVTGTVVTTGDSGTVTSTMIADGTIVNGDINASAGIALSKLATSTAGNIIVYNASGVPTAVAETGDVTISDAGVTAIASGVIVDADINASAAIDKTKISGTAITAADTGTVTSAMILDGTIVNGDINAAAAIALSKLASGTSGQIIVANSSGVPTWVSESGDVTISDTGVTAISSGVIVDADVSSSAAIAHSKLANGTAGQVLLGTTTTGVITATTISGDITINGAGVASIAANAVALGTDTTGDYVASLVAGTGVTLTNNSGEGATPTVAIGQSVATSASPSFGSLSTTGALYVGTDLHVGGTYYTTTETNLAIQDSFIYLNDGNTISNPDLGWAGNYNDGTYAHAGIFRDASDGKFKFFDSYTPEPTDPINTAHASYSAAPVVAERFESTITTGTSPLSVSSSTVVTNLNADLLDGQHGSYYAPLASPTFTGTVTLPTGTVTSGMILDGTIVNADIDASAAIAHSKLANATAGQVLLGTTTTGVVTATTVSGDVTITGAGVTAIGSGVIVNADVNASAAIALSKLATGTAGTVVLHNASGVPTATAVSGDVTISDTGVTAIGSGVIVNADINASAAIDKTKISGTAITAGDTGTVTSTMIADGTIVNADINASAAIAHSKLANATAGQVLLGTTTTGVVTATTVSGDITITGAGVTAIASGAVVDADINASAAITHSKLANITAGSVLLGNASNVPTATALSGDVTINSSGVTAIGSGVIVNADINASAAIDKTKISGTAVTVADTGTVTSTMIADGTIVNADISSTAAIDLGKLADVSTNAQTASYSLVLADKNKVVEMNVGSANNLTVPLNSSQAFPVGSQINILQTGAGQTTIVATGGVTINATPGLKMRAQWSYATLIKRATDTWVLVGDISA